MKNIQLWIIILVVLCFACINLSQKESSILRQEEKKESSSKKTIEKEKHNKTNIELSQKDIIDLEKSAKFQISSIELYRKQLIISTESKLVYELLGNDLSDNFLNKKYKNRISIQDQKYELDDEFQIIKKYSLGNSFFKVFYYAENQTYYLACAKILDDEINLQLGIRIGQSKDDFFSRIFYDSDKYNYESIDTVFTGNETGDIEQCFLFREDTLSEISITTSMNWIDFELQ